jgi:hypothetical protein
MNARCIPTRILPAHPTDQVSQLTGNGGATGLPASNLPSPEEAKASAMPGLDGFGLNNDQRRASIPPDAGQVDPKEAIR